MQYIWSEVRKKEVDECIDLIKYMLQRVLVLLSQCSSQTDAIKFFKVTSNRGLNLESIDIVKATIWETIPENKHVSSELDRCCCWPFRPSSVR